MTINPIVLFRMIFDYWCIWMTVPVETNLWFLEGGNESLMWYDGNNASFWYLLNVEWYRMNDKLYAAENNKEPFDIWLNDFHPEYVAMFYQ